MARCFSFIFLACVLLGFAHSQSPGPRCLDSNKVYECRSDWDTGTCADRFDSPPFVETPQNVCKCYCNRGLYETSCGDCVTFNECP